MHRLYDVKDQVIIITGGAGLIGRQYVKFLTEAGATVVIADNDEESALQIVKNYGNNRSIALKVDIANPNSVKKMVNNVIQKYNKINALVNNAALDPKFDPEHANEHMLTFENYPIELWKNGIDINVTGMFLCTQAVAPYMLEQGKGVVVNISSIYGLVGPDQRLYERDDHLKPISYKPVIYSVTKSAVLGFTKYLATYWAGKNIRVNTLTLGGVFNNHEDEFVRRYSWRNPLGRMARSDEYCGALLFLLSDASSYMTGANLVIDGGWTAW